MKFNSKEGINFIRDKKIIIDQQVTKKIDDLPPNIRMIAKRCILTGGAIASIFHNESPNDYDLLFLFSRDLDQFKSNSTMDILTPFIKDYVEYGTSPLNKSKGKCVTDWAVTLTNNLQFILRTVDHRATFDFVHCMPYFDITRKKLFISHAQFDSIMKKEIYVNPNCANGKPAEHRIGKYTARGWEYIDPLNVEYVKEQVEIMKLLQKQGSKQFEAFVTGMVTK